MRSPGINGEAELRPQPANPGSPGKMAVKMECMCVSECMSLKGIVVIFFLTFLPYVAGKTEVDLVIYAKTFNNHK